MHTGAANAAASHSSSASQTESLKVSRQNLIQHLDLMHLYKYGTSYYYARHPLAVHSDVKRDSSRLYRTERKYSGTQKRRVFRSTVSAGRPWVRIVIAVVVGPLCNVDGGRWTTAAGQSSESVDGNW
ncbi:unnamed protein product [Scytosiphon promiscuus]